MAGTMKAVFAFGVSCCAVILTAQVRVAPPVPSPSRPALGLTNASSRPLGGVALPTFPARPAAPRKARTTHAARYIGPVYYVPNAYDYPYDSSADLPPDAYVEPQPVRRRLPPPQQRMDTRVDDGTTISYEQPEPPPENYYLIAYKNHTVYPALSYWIDGQTLHYVTTDNAENQASMAFIDVAQTTKLNSDRAVPFIAPVN
jgi:hypothetical protein